MPSTGRFTWFELLTTDLAAARAFYREVLGWQTRPAGTADHDVWMAGDGPVGGLRALPERSRVRGAPPNWLGHIAVASVEIAARRLIALGAVQLGPLQQRAEVGRFAIVRDAQGAVLAVCEPASSLPALRPGSGAVLWSELHTTDAEAAWTAYSSLFGWREAGVLDLGPELGGYRLFAWDGAGRPAGGISNAARGPQVSTHWLQYFQVDDLEAALARVAALGGTVLGGPTEGPAGGLIAQAEDAQGAAFALQQPPPSRSAS